MKKNEIRAIYKELRKSLSEQELVARSMAIFDLTCRTYNLVGKKVSIFLPIARFSEIDTWPFLNQIEAAFYLPVITGKNQLEHIKYENPEQIKVSDWGIPEPTYGERLEVSELDFVLVPLLAIDKKGFRVGYGKGFYDQFLAQCAPDCLFIGLSYFDAIENVEDLHEADISLNSCVTPTEVLEF